MFDPRKGHKPLSAQIEEATLLIQDYPLLPNAQMIAILEAAGFEREVAVNMVVFVPMAFFRVLVADRHLLFPESCKLVDSSGEAMEVDLTDNVLFETAQRVAREHYASGMSKEEISGVIFRSGEFIQINAMLGGGFSLDQVMIEPAVIDVDSEQVPGQELEEEFFEDEEPAPSGTWWKFW